MQRACEKDVRASTHVASAGAAPTLTTNVEAILGPLLLSDLPVRAASCCFDLPIEVSIPAGQRVSYTGFIERSTDGVTWTRLEGPVSTGSWANPTGAVAPLVVRSAIRIGGDLIQDGLNRVRAKVTPVFPATATPTVRGLSVLLGGLDTLAAVDFSQRAVI